MAGDERRISLEVERLRTEATWRAEAEEYVPLSVAAAIVFHQAHPASRASMPFDDYSDALNIAASALSRLISVFTAAPAGGAGRRAVSINLLRHRFALGATRLTGMDGTSIGELSVRRSEVISALSLIRRAGLPFSFAPFTEEEGVARRSSAMPPRVRSDEP